MIRSENAFPLTEIGGAKTAFHAMLLALSFWLASCGFLAEDVLGIRKPTGTCTYLDLRAGEVVKKTGVTQDDCVCFPSVSIGCEWNED